ncbi:hypothetical protein [Aquabacter cavernae]|uniref:hypothetical protein n=1 Tax=Aquabacter cavernae TaxID=2496029 RepID=UPI00196B5DA1|nr:hypothetical protein [Aquabacter cavernae]
MKANIFAVFIGVTALSITPVAAQGVVRGAQQGAAVGNDVAGPVGGAVGGAVGAVGGGIAGGVKGVLGIPQSTSTKGAKANTPTATRTAQPGTTMSPADPHGGDAHTEGSPSRAR